MCVCVVRVGGETASITVSRVEISTDAGPDNRTRTHTRHVTYGTPITTARLLNESRAVNWTDLPYDLVSC